MRKISAPAHSQPVATRYRAERLLNSLPLLLWDEPMNDLRGKYFLQKDVADNGFGLQGFVTAYKAVWPKC